MPYLRDVSYSLEETVAAVSDYFDFLVKLYLPESLILRPPEGGWPEVNSERVQGLGKSDEVIKLLRHLPYINENPSDLSGIDGGPSGCKFYNWLRRFRDLDRPDADPTTVFESAKTMTEPIEEEFVVPPHVVGLLSTKDDLFLLDTQLGIIYWYECPGSIQASPTREPVWDNPDEDPLDEREGEHWRCFPAWAVQDFFELLKDHFREQRTVPVSPITVYDLDNFRWSSKVKDEVMPLVKATFREHGWPDLDRYRKEECLQAVRRIMEQHLGEQHCGGYWPDWLAEGNS
ncbi:hypothetical protein VTJ49DRAFT_7003 [Mycothermus thermophilus]|uniref:Knr4/Smi1-like domain-containing protein n=1 Tax=Humicola insolens TaxID=85995 RepID=A0ABR3VI57_HUMIN